MRVALIGKGHWGNNIYRILKTFPLEVIVVDAKQGQYRDISQVKEFDIQACIIATPADTHYDIAWQALYQGWDVFIEKPMTKRADTADMLVKIAKRKDKILMVDHQFLYNPAVVKMREIIHCGGIGELYYLYARRLKFGSSRVDIDTLWNFAPHDISISNYLVGGMPERVSAQGWSYIHRDIADVVFLTLYYAGGVNSHIQISWIGHERVRDLNVFGEFRALSFDDIAGTVKLMNDQESFVVEFEKKEPLYESIKTFLDCVQSRRQPLTNGVNGVEVVRVLTAAQESMSNNGEIRKV